MRHLSLVLSLLALILIATSCDQITTPVTTDTADSDTPKTFILAIDGGGIKGIIPATFLSLLADSLGKQPYQLFDVIGGTSTGGLISVGLTAPKDNSGVPRTVQEVLNFYKNDCGTLMYKNDGLTGPKYYANADGKGIEAFLIDTFQTMSLVDAQDNLKNKRVKQVFTTTYLINSSGGQITNPQMGKDFGPYLFNWYDAKQNADDNYYLWEAARATSAAPYYFPVAILGGGNGSRSSAPQKWGVDGGVMSNDPAMWGISEALRTKIASSLDDMVVISLGDGINMVNAGINVAESPSNGPVNSGKGQEYGFWGASWFTFDPTDGESYMKNLNDVFFEGVALVELALYANQFVPADQLQQIAQGTNLTYCRVQPELPAALTPMDKCANVSKLDTFALNYFTDPNRGKPLLDSVLHIMRKQQ